MKVYSMFRSKDLITVLNSLGLSVTYYRIANVLDMLSDSLVTACIASDVVCPSNMSKNAFTVCGFDNVDHDPSSTSSMGSFHGTAITTMQNCKKTRSMTHQKLVWPEKFLRISSVPDSYKIVPEVLVNGSAEVPASESQHHSEPSSSSLALFQNEQKTEQKWLDSISRLLPKTSKNMAITR
eukprot:Pompholyxophrys_punicea_v1_NODE_10_length_6905_cov_7.951686.p6 type:complete len:181 gc:universal NODE_10_length_6905_cov_7.951686:5893-5351(-)